MFLIRNLVGQISEMEMIEWVKMFIEENKRVEVFFN